MAEHLQEAPDLWRESFSYFSDDSLHLLTRLYLNNNGLLKTHSRELIIAALWHHVNREEFNLASLDSLSSFDIQLLLLLYLGLNSVQQLAESLPEHSCIEICLKLLHLQERMLVLRSSHKNRKASNKALPKHSSKADKAEAAKDAPVHLIPKVEKQLHSAEGAHFVIAPQFRERLQQRLDFCTIFHGLKVPTKHKNASAESPPDLLLSSELILASALYFAQEGFPSKRKISKTQLNKFLNCFSQLNEEQTVQLRELNLSCDLLCESDQHQLQFSVEVFEQLWHAPYYQRMLAIQAYIAKLSREAFAKLLSIWPKEVWLPASQLQRLLSLMGIPAAKTSECIQTMVSWKSLLSRSAAEMQQLQTDETQKSPNNQKAQGNQNESQSREAFYYQLNPKISDSILGTPSAPPTHESDKAAATEQDAANAHNRLSSNWELFCDLRHPETYIELLLCARLENFGDLSLFRIEKLLFQKYFNGEEQKFQRFLQHCHQLERSGIHISSLIQQQWQEWFNDSTRFQLFKNCLLVCQPSYNELISRLLGEDDGRTSPRRGAGGSDILCNPQPGVFYLNEERRQHWHNSLNNAGIQFSEPFAQKYPFDFELSANPAAAGESAKKAGDSAEELPLQDFKFPIHKVIQQWHDMKQAASISKEAKAPKESETAKAGKAPSTGSDQVAPALEEETFHWDNWPTAPLPFVQSRQLVCSNSDLSQLHIHFREARGVDYTAKRNLLHSLLTARNHMAIITVAEGDDLDLVPYIVLPLNLNGPKGDPSLLALDLRQERLLRFRVKNITRVNEVFYSLINVCLLSLLPSAYIYQLEERFSLEEQQNPEHQDDPESPNA